MASIDIRGARLEYSEAGSGEPLVLVHGSASDHRTWRLQREAFDDRFRVITYSRRYHWPNQPIGMGVDYAMAEHVDDLEALLHSLEAAPAHLIGHSYGAFLCLLLATKRPHLVRTLVLEEPPVLTLFVSNRPKPWEVFKLLLSRPRTAVAIIRFGAKGVVPATKAFRRGDLEAGARIFGDAVFGPGSFDRLPESQREQVRANLTNIRAELLGSGFAPLNPDHVRSIQVPTLFVTGEHSIDLFSRLTDGLQELLPHAERVEVRGASHLIHEGNAPAYNAAVLSFLGAPPGGMA